MQNNIIKKVITISYELSIDTTTSEIVGTKILDEKSSEKPAKSTKSKEITGDPILTLEENKYIFNEAAIALMGIEVDDKIDIKYEDSKTGTIPVIGTNEAFGTKGGNRFTKSHTVACRGKKHDELAKYGSEFKIEAHPSKEGLFILISGEALKSLEGDQNIELPDDLEIETEDETDIDFDINSLVSDKDTKIEEVDSSFFDLNKF